MSNYYSQDDLINITADLIECLRGCEDGMEISTYQLLNSAGYEMSRFDEGELFTIHAELMKMARANHITLDMSAHEYRLEGLAYNLDFVVKNKNAQIKCPYCGSRNTARVIYGYPASSKMLKEQLDAGKLILGGCCIRTVQVDGRHIIAEPSRQCNDCQKEFGTPPLIIAKDRSSAERYRDVVTAIEFSMLEHRGGHTDIKITKNPNGALVKVDVACPGKIPPADRQIKTTKWYRILDELYSHMYLHEWKKSYEPKEWIIKDGESWELIVRLTGNRVRRCHGSNAYPPYWAELKKLFKEFNPKKVAGSYDIIT